MNKRYSVSIQCDSKEEAEACILTLKAQGYNVSDNPGILWPSPKPYLVLISCADAIEQASVKARLAIDYDTHTATIDARSAE